MKPNFALDFRNDAITLLHRTARGWQLVGQVALDTADLAEALAFLRSTALGLSPKGMTTKLVIPNSQILYTRVSTTAPEPSRRRRQVARGLEGLTPYTVEELAFDISGEGPDVQVAVIAHETLAEAEAFATEHRFNPMSFVAVPEAGTFQGEPWFGPTKFAATFLTEGQRVDRDQSLVPTITGDLPGQGQVAEVPVVAAEPAVEPAAAIPPAADVPFETAVPTEIEQVRTPPQGVEEPPHVVSAPPPAPAPPSEPFAANPAPDQPDAPPVEATVPDVAVAPEPAAEVPTPEMPAPDMPAGPASALEPEEVLARSLASEDPPPADLVFADPVPADPLPASLSIQAAAASPDESSSEPLVDEAPMALDVVDDLPEVIADAATPVRATAAPASVLDPSIPDDLPPPPATSIMMAFASRRAAEVAAKDAASKSSASKTGPARAATGKAPVQGAITATRTGPPAKVTTVAPRSPSPTVVALPQRAGAQPAAATAAAAARPAVKGSASGKTLRGLGALVTAPGIPGAKERRTPVQPISPPTGPVSAASAAAATLTKPGTKPYGGGLGSRNLAPRGKPRYLGLILTGILLVFLALVAAWSTLFLEARNNATTPAPEAVVEAVPTPDDEMLADLQGPAEVLPPEDVRIDTSGTVAAAAVVETVPVPAEPAPVTGLGSETAAATLLADDLQDEIFLAAMDEPPAMPDALSLPRPAERNDPLPSPAVPPPPFGTVYQFDAAGQIVPTAEGVVTPEGVPLFAGAPKLVPPPRPADLVPAVGAPVAAAEPAVTPDATVAPAPDATAALTDPVLAAPATPEPAFADPALAGARPVPRPDSLIPPTLNADDDASLAPASSSRFATLRPLSRPADLVPASQLVVAAATPPPANPAADLGAQAASLTAQANATIADRSPLLLAVSRKPAPRPQDMSRAVEAAVAVASRQPDPKPPVAEPAQKTELEADDEPEIAKSMPRLPTKTSVAKQATFVNAINLSKVNLIGVYGSASNRYALIRQTNGRYKKVKVGDSFDGGRVAAITASEVRYQKSGKMLTLALPKS